jgi:hypothetical protein
MDYSIDGPCAELDEKISTLEDYFEHSFEEGLSVDHARHLIGKLDDLKELRQRLVSFNEAYDEIIAEEGLQSYSSASKHAKSDLRKITVEITEGMLNQSLLSLTKAKKMGTVRVEERFVIQPPEGAPFETKLLRVGNRLKERGRIGAFYENEKLEDLDRVILEETKPKHWKLYVDEEYRRRRIDIEKNGLGF